MTLDRARRLAHRRAGRARLSRSGARRPRAAARRRSRACRRSTRLVAAERRAQVARTRTSLGGRYRVARLLGSGGMGRVYLARDEFPGRDVAVKVVAPPVDARSAEGYRRFVREAEASRRCATRTSSRRSPRTRSWACSPWSSWRAARSPIGSPARRTRRADAHAGRSRCWPASKPRTRAASSIATSSRPNIFFAASGEAKLGDFGVAHLVDLGATQTAGFIGTLAYMSPEQISRRAAHLRRRCLRARRHAVPGAHRPPALPRPRLRRRSTWAKRRRRRRAFAPSAAAWDPLIARALEKSPADRFASLEQMRNALLAIPVEPTTAAAPATPSADAEAIAPAERYTITAELDGGLVQATDAKLGREVVIEILPVGAEHLPWLRAIARLGGARLQRVLRLERIGDGTTRVVYEALTGRTPRPPSLAAARARAPAARARAAARGRRRARIGGDLDRARRSRPGPAHRRPPSVGNRRRRGIARAEELSAERLTGRSRRTPSPAPGTRSTAPCLPPPARGRCSRSAARA